ncbi:hypothetical protein [Peribacillus deserti]|uniref:hypothetical protein n=1 Tax=Peribacillus deserti TaxID=673318 RepID=UPI0021529F0A|nr:hypothetical protein [Peribacillus deserti]
MFPIMQQLYEMLVFLSESLCLTYTRSIHTQLEAALLETERLTNLCPQFLLELDLPSHRSVVNTLLLQTSELVRGKVPEKKSHTRKKPDKTRKVSDFIGANLRRGRF